MMSDTDSAFDKSSLPFKKALFVNSPGSANLAPLSTKRFRIFFNTSSPPWHCISMTSSAVYDLGLNIVRTITSSMKLFFTSSKIYP